jgi:hypothetical protein
MTGEKRLYDRNFRRPYSAWLTPESTADNLVFRVPFLPIPGNHDYYDLRGWVLWLAKLPLVGPGLKAIIQELFAFGMPEGGSEMGKVFMEAFVDLKADTSSRPLAYAPGALTKVPNRYYRFRYGSVDFFALDSNTLDAPPPWRTTANEVREAAANRVETLREQYRALDQELKERQLRLDAWRKDERERLSHDPSRTETISSIAVTIGQALRALAKALRVEGEPATPCAGPADEVAKLAERWEAGEAALRAAADSDSRLTAIETLEEASDDACASLRGVEGCLGAVGEGGYKSAIVQARDAVDRAVTRWAEVVSALPSDLCDEIHAYSERALDIQRELALEQRRTRFKPEDHDSVQLAWLRMGLEQSVRENPDGWRVVYLHHPLYTTIGNHCEQSDVQDIRSNLLEILAGRAHLVLSGHAHAFEWFRSARLPGSGIFVTGGGGQVSLRRSILEPRSYTRHRGRYDSLVEAGVEEWCGAGRGPAAQDGRDGNLYHYLRVDVERDVLTVRPMGARRLEREQFRAESPFPVYHVPALNESGFERDVRELRGITVTRTGQVRPVWSADEARQDA